MPGGSKATGKCLCGAVKITLTGDQREVGACHCDMCRRWGGGPNMAVLAGPNVEVEGREHITVFRSSQWAERAFCRTCGSNLYYRVVEANDHFVCAGLLDDPGDLEMTGQVFIDEKPAFYDFANETQNMTGAEVFAMFAPPAEQ